MYVDHHRNDEEVVADHSDWQTIPERVRSKVIDGQITRLRYYCWGKGPIWKIAVAVGIHPSMLSMYVNGVRAVPNRDLWRLAKFLNVEPVDLLGTIDPNDLIFDIEPPREGGSLGGAMMYVARR